METLIPTTETSLLGGGLRLVEKAVRKIARSIVAHCARGLVSFIFCLGNALLLLEERPIVQSIQRRRARKAAPITSWPGAKRATVAYHRSDRLVRSD